VCKRAYKSTLKLQDGREVALFKQNLKPPFVSFLVVTKHEMAKQLFNTRFQLSFSTVIKRDGLNSARDLIIGRSSSSDMVLNYRTVSARHGGIQLKNGRFIFTDSGSSNGSYLYLRKPQELKPGVTTQLRLGRSFLSFKVTQRWGLLRSLSSRRNTRSDNTETTATTISSSASAPSGEQVMSTNSNNNFSVNILEEVDNFKDDYDGQNGVGGCVCACSGKVEDDDTNIAPQSQTQNIEPHSEEHLKLIMSLCKRRHRPLLTEKPKPNAVPNDVFLADKNLATNDGTVIALEEEKSNLMEVREFLPCAFVVNV